MTVKKMTESALRPEESSLFGRVYRKGELNECCRSRNARAKEGCSTVSPAAVSLDGLNDVLNLSAFAVQDGLSLRESAHSVLTSLHRPLGAHVLNAETLIEIIEESHGAEAPKTVGKLRDAFADFRRELMSHLFLEEDVLYPWIFSGNGWSALELIDDLQYQHKVLAMKIKTVSVPALRLVKMKDVCDGRIALLRTLKKLEALLNEHIRAEETILFPRALRVSVESTGENKG